MKKQRRGWDGGSGNGGCGDGCGENGGVDNSRGSSGGEGGCSDDGGNDGSDEGCGGNCGATAMKEAAMAVSILAARTVMMATVHRPFMHCFATRHPRLPPATCHPPLTPRHANATCKHQTHTPAASSTPPPLDLLLATRVLHKMGSRDATGHVALLMRSSVVALDKKERDMNLSERKDQVDYVDWSVGGGWVIRGKGRAGSVRKVMGGSVRGRLRGAPTACRCREFAWQGRCVCVSVLQAPKESSAILQGQGRWRQSVGHVK